MFKVSHIKQALITYTSNCLKLQALDRGSRLSLIDHLANSTAIDNKNTYMIRELKQYLCWENIHAHENCYLAIYTQLHAIFSSFKEGRGGKRANQFNQLYGGLIQSYTLEFVVHLWALELFRVMSLTTPQPHSILLKLYNPDKGITNAWTLIEYVEQVYTRINALNQLLSIKGHLIIIDNFEFFIKKILHEVVRRLALGAEPKILSVTVESYKELEPAISKTKLIRSLGEGGVVPVKALKAPIRPSYQKITMLSTTLNFTLDKLAYFAISLEAPTIISNADYQVSHSLLWFNCHSLFVTKKSKMPSKISDLFLMKIRNIYETAAFPCPVMCEITKVLILDEYQKTLQQYSELLTSYKKQDPNLNLNSLLSELLKQKTITVSLNNQSVKRVVATLNNMTTQLFTQNSKVVQTLLADSLQISEELNTRVERTAHYSEKIQQLISRTQTFFSKADAINTALSFLDFLSENNFEKFYYNIYCDFRGRVYYLSRCSPQAYWYYRFLFHLGPISNYSDLKNSNLIPKSWVSDPDLWSSHKLDDTNVQTVCLSIGLLFKADFVDPSSGAIAISRLVDKGFSIYLKYHANTPQQWLALGWEYKKLIEIIYYCTIINQIRAGSPKKYYLQKDTTCSMAQHGGKLLGYNLEHLHYLNLNNVETMFDTYQIFLNKLIEILQPLTCHLNDKTRQAIQRHMNRNLFKNLIMTAEYGVTHYTAYREFLQTLNGLVDEPVVRKFFADLNTFNVIYNFLTNGSTDTIFYKQSKKTWADNLIKQNTTNFTLTDITIPIGYYKPKIANIYFTTCVEPRTRVSINTTLQTLPGSEDLIVDQQKTLSALYVNSVHALDASYLRSITFHTGTRGIPIITIHDGFCVPFFAETTLRSIANNMFFENIPQTHYLPEQHWQPDSTTILV